MIMSGSFSRNKGQRAERAVVKLLQPIVDKVSAEFGKESTQIERNLMQSHKGGYDLVGLDWLALEVKHQENLNVSGWWKQCVEQAKPGQDPVLFYKQNRSSWRVRVIMYLPVGTSRFKCPAEINLESFLKYFEHRVRLELSK